MPLLSVLRNAGHALLRLLYPPRCVLCGRLISRVQEAQGLCTFCRERLPWASYEVQRLEQSIAPCVSALWYKGTVRSSILRYKFSGRSCYRLSYGHLLRRALEDAAFPAPDYVTWAPLSRQRRFRRGYDQAELLAREAAQRYGQRPVALLRKRRNNAPQSSLGPQERLQNARNLYEVCGGLNLRGCRILLVDDIITTGATLDQCALSLFRAGADQVWCLTLARSVHDRQS